MRVLFCGSGWFPVVEAIRARAQAGAFEFLIWDRSKPLEKVAPELAVEVILPSNGGTTRAVIEATTSLRLIQQPAVGIDGIDLEAARERGIPVCNVPGMNTDAVAQATLLLMLALARRLNRARASFEQATIGVPLGIELGGRTLGLIGRGQTGSKVAALAEALGMRVIAVRSNSSQEELFELLAASDVVSIHCPLTSVTRGLFDRNSFARMKSGAFLINCSRGAIIDRPSLEEALASGRLGGVGLDVFWEEPWRPEEALYRHPDVVTLPHVGGSTEESFGRIADIVAENLRRLLAGETLLHRLV